MCSTSSASTRSVERRPGRGVLGQQRADGVGDLPPSAVADGQVDRRPRPVAGVLLGLLQDGDGLRRQQLQRAHRRSCHRRPGPARSAATSSMIRSSGASSGSGRERLSVESRKSVTTETPASSHQPSRSTILSAPRRWPWATSFEPDRPGPAPVAVDDHADVAGQVGALQRAGQPALVDRVERLADLPARPHAVTLGPAAVPGRDARTGRGDRVTEVTAAPDAARPLGSVTSVHERPSRHRDPSAVEADGAELEGPRGERRPPSWTRASGSSTPGRRPTSPTATGSTPTRGPGCAAGCTCSPSSAPSSPAPSSSRSRPCSVPGPGSRSRSTA